MNLKERMNAWREKMARRGRLVRSRRGAASAEGVGYALVVAGAITAIGGLIGLLFVPAATFTTLDGELFLLFGVILAVIGVAVRQASA